MGIGHVALALGASRAAPRLNVGWLVFAAVLADFLLGIFAALGMEHATVPPDYAHQHYLLFTFPYSHGLLALLLWATVFGFLVSRAFGLESRRIWLIAALVVLSHFLLDGLVHIAGLPLAGENSPKLGLGLWKNMPFELALETLMTFAGIAIYWKLSRGSSLSRYGMTVFMLLFLAMMWTELAATVAPEPKVLTVSWIVAPVVLAAIAYGLDWQRVRHCVPVGSGPQTRNLHPTPEI
jgi:hypothetical protein